MICYSLNVQFQGQNVNSASNYCYVLCDYSWCTSDGKFNLAYKLWNISQNTIVYYIKQNLGRHVSTLFQVIFRPSTNRSKVIKVYSAFWYPKRLQCIIIVTVHMLIDKLLTYTLTIILLSTVRICDPKMHYKLGLPCICSLSPEDDLKESRKMSP